MYYSVKKVEAIDSTRISLEFEDGKRGVFDMAPYLDRGVFRALRNDGVFRAVHIENDTATWPGDIDIAPERLYTDCVEA